jgi:thiamine biosynthesis lipoprotein
MYKEQLFSSNIKQVLSSVTYNSRNMKRTRVIMGMPITIEIVDDKVKEADIASVFDYFVHVENTFSIYKKDSEISKLNNGKIALSRMSADMKLILALADDTKNESRGYFDIRNNSKKDPTGIVKGWAIYNAANLLKSHGFQNFMIDAGGDMQVSGRNRDKNKWTKSLVNPFNKEEIIKIFELESQGIATSGKNQHIYNPHNPAKKIKSIGSITVIGPTVYDAKRFAIAAYAMGEKGLHFIDKLDGFEAYMINAKGKASATFGLKDYLLKTYEAK